MHLDLSRVLDGVELVGGDLGHHSRYVVQLVDLTEIFLDAREHRLDRVEIGRIMDVSEGTRLPNCVVDRFGHRA